MAGGSAGAAAAVVAVTGAGAAVERGAAKVGVEGAAGPVAAGTVGSTSEGGGSSEFAAGRADAAAACRRRWRWRRSRRCPGACPRRAGCLARGRVDRDLENRLKIGAGWARAGSVGRGGEVGVALRRTHGRGVGVGVHGVGGAAWGGGGRQQ